ncbi:hypothetical protein [Streptomyces regalis]|uniref:Uncharacterized protein n=1 Tax=Streptomyces regalis TaxID=68262 RepID=A0A101J9M9_9ACTN|nr:hypothetical protein [Streptomyces regalis]KUL22773.1 hypothetical protein ADL12_41340 [Streptomyces regalis]
MGEIVVVFELDKAVATRVPRGEERPVRRVHAAPAAPGAPTATGPRTICGKDTFAMETTGRKPSERRETPWYPEEYASAVCPDCDAVMET